MGNVIMAVGAFMKNEIVKKVAMTAALGAASEVGMLTVEKIYKGLSKKKGLPKNYSEKTIEVIC